jgi:hypothetical protein
MFKTEEPVIEQTREDFHIMLHCLLHFRQHVTAQKQCLLEWQNSQTQIGLSDDVYVKVVDGIKKDVEMCESDSYNNLVCSVGLTLADDIKENVMPLIEKEHDDVAKEWLEAGLVKYKIRDLMTHTSKHTSNNTPGHTALNHVKVGRNELCPCLSGKKYKKCCGSKY